MPSSPCVLAGSGEGGEHGYDLLAMEDTEGVTFVAVGLRVREGGFMVAAPYGISVKNGGPNLTYYVTLTAPHGSVAHGGLSPAERSEKAPSPFGT